MAAKTSLIKFLCSDVFNIIGALMIGLSVPMGHGIFVTENPMIDFLILAPIGILLVGTSYYYKFIKK
jgi:hypothetical protein